MSRAYEEVVEFIASGTTPNNVIAFRPSDETKARVSELLDRRKNDDLTPDEAAELEHFLQLEHIMRLAKARAQHYLAT